MENIIYNVHKILKKQTKKSAKLLNIFEQILTLHTMENMIIMLFIKFIVKTDEKKCKITK